MQIVRMGKKWYSYTYGQLDIEEIPKKLQEIESKDTL